MISQTLTGYQVADRYSGAAMYTSTDARSVFQQAYTWLSAGGNLFVRNGKYNLTGNIRPGNNTVTEGESWNAIIAGEAACSTIFYLPGTSAGHLVNIVIKNLRLDGSRMGSGKGLYGTYIDGLRVDGLWVHDTPHTGIGPDYLNNFVVQNCLVERCSRKYDGNGIGIGGPSMNGLLTHNTVLGTKRISTYGNGLVLESLTMTGMITDVIVSDNIAKGCANSGFFGKGISHCTVANNIFSENLANGVLIYDWDSRYAKSNHVTISGNDCHHNKDSGIRIRCVSNLTRDFFVTGNMLSYNVRGVLTYALGTAITGNFISYNTFGIYLYKTENLQTGNTFIGNTVNITSV